MFKMIEDATAELKKKELDWKEDTTFAVMKPDHPP